MWFEDLAVNIISGRKEAIPQLTLRLTNNIARDSAARHDWSRQATTREKTPLCGRSVDHRGYSFPPNSYKRPQIRTKCVVISRIQISLKAFFHGFCRCSSPRSTRSLKSGPAVILPATRSIYVGFPRSRSSQKPIRRRGGTTCDSGADARRQQHSLIGR